MRYDKAMVASKLRRWDKFLRGFRLPIWEEIPDLGLYMDQVVMLLTQYLDFLPPEIKEARVITASTINNYVRMKIMPEPLKKKYYRIHIAYLIMICTLKQSLPIAAVQKLIPMDLALEEVKSIYSAYVQRHHASAQYFIEQVRSAARAILDGDDDNKADATAATTDLIATAAITGGFARLMAEKLLGLEGRLLADEPGAAALPGME